MAFALFTFHMGYKFTDFRVQNLVNILLLIAKTWNPIFV